MFRLSKGSKKSFFITKQCKIARKIHVEIGRGEKCFVDGVLVSFER